MAGRRILDLNLLTIFEAVYETRNISAAATRLGMTQSAASHALARLRASLGDALFVRAGNSLKPTVTATTLYPTFRDSLDNIRAAIEGKVIFEPARARGAFRIAIPHISGPFIGLQLEKRIRKEAPFVSLSFDTRTLPSDLPLELEEGRVDLAVDWQRLAEGPFVHQQIFDDQLMLVTRRGHPRIGPSSSMAEVEAERFVSLHGRSSTWIEPPALRQLLALRRWKTGFRVSELLEIPLVVAATDYVGAIPLTIAGPLTATGQLQIMPMPIKIPPHPIVMTWHMGRRRDPRHVWLRRVVREEVRLFGQRAMSAMPA